MYSDYPEFIDLIDYVMDVNLDTFYASYHHPCKILFRTWIDIKLDAINTLSDNYGSIDNLYAKAAGKWFISGNSEVWYKWAKYKTDQGVIGSVDEPYSARWIYRWGIDNQKLTENIIFNWAQM